MVSRAEYWIPRIFRVSIFSHYTTMIIAHTPLRGIHGEEIPNSKFQTLVCDLVEASQRSYIKRQIYQYNKYKSKTLDCNYLVRKIREQLFSSASLLRYLMNHMGGKQIGRPPKYTRFADQSQPISHWKWSQHSSWTLRRKRLCYWDMQVITRNKD